MQEDRTLLELSCADKVPHRTKQRTIALRLNIFGIWATKLRFDYALMLLTLKTSTYIQLMDWQAQIAAQRLLETG